MGCMRQWHPNKNGNGQLFRLQRHATLRQSKKNCPTTITDLDGNSYGIKLIGNQTWTTKNLNVSKYRTGDLIPQVQDPTLWDNLTTGAWCYYENNSANGTIYGKLYNWYAVTDSRGLAPTGYHIPNNSEFMTLINYLGGGREDEGARLIALVSAKHRGY